MTNTRLAALEAVAEAARMIESVVNAGMFDQQDGADAFDMLESALAALDALPTPTPGEAVRVAMHRSRKTGEWCPMIEGTEDDYDLTEGPWDHIATLTARVPLPTTPTIPATVTLAVTP